MNFFFFFFFRHQTPKCRDAWYSWTALNQISPLLACLLLWPLRTASRWNIHTALHSELCSEHYTIHTEHCTVHSAHCTLYTTLVHYRRRRFSPNLPGAELSGFTSACLQGSRHAGKGAWIRTKSEYTCWCCFWKYPSLFWCCFVIALKRNQLSLTNDRQTSRDRKTLPLFHLIGCQSVKFFL